MPPGSVPAAMPSFKGPAAAARGHELFFDPVRENCGVCHAVGGRGIAIGPDLSASKPAEMLSAIGATGSRRMLTARLKNGEEFPALLAERNADQVRLYDLTGLPPVLRTLLGVEVVSLLPNASWRHSDFVKDYSRPELEEIVVYLRWAASRR